VGLFAFVRAALVASPRPVLNHPPGRFSLRAFTLLEILVALALVVALTGLGLGAIVALRERAAVVQTRADLAVLTLALASYQSRHGEFPAGELDPVAGSRALFRALNEEDGANEGTGRRGMVDPGRLRSGPWTDGQASAEVFLDPWGRPYRYCSQATSEPGEISAAGAALESTYTLLSAGPDGRATLSRAADGRVQAAGPDNADNISPEDAP